MTAATPKKIERKYNIKLSKLRKNLVISFYKDAEHWRKAIRLGAANYLFYQ